MDQTTGNMIFIGRQLTLTLHSKVQFVHLLAKLCCNYNYCYYIFKLAVPQFYKRKLQRPHSLQGHFSLIFFSTKTS